MKKKSIIPKFNGVSVSEAYLVWEMKVDHIFNSHNYKNEDKVLMATLEFEGLAMN